MGYQTAALSPAGNSYSRDYFGWSQDQAALLRDGRFGALDTAHLIAELECGARAERRSVLTQMIVLIEHLLKLGVSQNIAPRDGWRRVVADARTAIELILEDNCSLRGQRAELFAKAWPRSLGNAIEELRASEGVVQLEVMRANAPPFTVDQALYAEFFPGV